MTTRPVPAGTVRVVDGTWMDRFRRVDHRIWDALLAILVLAASMLGFLLQRGGPGRADADALGAVLVVAACVPIAWRRRAPLIVAAVVGASAAAYSFLEYRPALILPLMVSLYTAAAYRERDRLVPILLPVAVVTGVALHVADQDVARQGFNWVEILTEIVVTAGIPITLGRMTFNRRRRVARDRDLATHEAVTAERARIARELHDVVAHHMSVMVVQAGAARAVGAKDPAAANEALRQIETSGRTGLAEMRRLLEILKTSDGENDLTPQPGLAGLDDLLDGMRATGLPVEAVVEGVPRPLPPGVDLSAYRIVQEALTNALKHAGEASARVLVRYEADALEVEIVDDGRGMPGDGSPAGGQGLIGMRERVQLFGGTLDAGPKPGGGFLVRARLPVTREEPP
jgi:signal transduction histidine kinase